MVFMKNLLSTLELRLANLPVPGYGDFMSSLFGKDWTGHHETLPYFLGAIEVLKEHDVVAKLAEEFHGAVAFALHGFLAPAFWLAFAGFALATFLYLFRTDLPAKLAAFPPFALAARVLTMEHRLYPAVLRRFAAGDRTPLLLS